MPENKDQWYDGRFYDFVIAPNQDKVFGRIKGFIKGGSNVLDVGCGTGRLEFQLADKCKKIDGVDLSARNISVAVRKLTRRPAENIAFHHSDILDFLGDASNPYDYAVLAYVLHEIDEGIRQAMLAGLTKAAHEIIMVDYLAPQPRTTASLVNDMVEYAAGPDHYRNFTSFIRAHGLVGLAKGAGVVIISEEQNTPPGSHILVVGRG